MLLPASRGANRTLHTLQPPPGCHYLAARRGRDVCPAKGMSAAQSCEDPDAVPAGRDGKSGPSPSGSVTAARMDFFLPSGSFSFHDTPKWLGLSAGLMGFVLSVDAHDAG